MIRLAINLLPMLNVPSYTVNASIMVYSRKTLKWKVRHQCITPTSVENQLLISFLSIQNCILGCLIQSLNCIYNSLADVELSQNYTHSFMPYVVKGFLQVYEILVVTRSPMENLHAGDMSVTAESVKELEDKLRKWQGSLYITKNIRLKINTQRRRTEVLVRSRGASKSRIKVIYIMENHGEKIDHVTESKFLISGTY